MLLTTEDLAKHFNISSRAIRKHLQKMGVQKLASVYLIEVGSNEWTVLKWRILNAKPGPKKRKKDEKTP